MTERRAVHTVQRIQVGSLQWIDGVDLLTPSLTLSPRRLSAHGRSKRCPAIARLRLRSEP
eukprot:3455441-Rhodomonas_salina.4